MRDPHRTLRRKEQTAMDLSTWKQTGTAIANALDPLNKLAQIIAIVMAGIWAYRMHLLTGEEDIDPEVWVSTQEIEPSYAIPCTDWNFLKEGISKASSQQWVLPSIGTVLIGAALAELGTIFSGAIPETPPRLLAWAWAFTVTAAISGLACVATAILRQLDARGAGNAVLSHMDLIEGRFTSRRTT
jgi:hypothetical protein